MNGVERGCLIIADISGYTKYLTGVELDHSTDILADLINTIVNAMAGTFTLAKLEGDAIFAYAADPDDLSEGPSLVTLIEGTYFAFRHRQEVIDRATSCTCDACRKIPTLNLKFVVHHGSYVVHEVAGSKELVGPDVIVAHRLLKNEVKEKFGLNGYTFFSGHCAERYGLDTTALTLHPHTELYDDVGEIEGWVHDLDTRWAEELERRVVRLTADEPGVMALEFEFPAPPSVVWDHLTSPSKRLAWQLGTDDMIQDNPSGTRGVGTQNHCVHGDGTIIEEEVLDWKPFNYVTVQVESPIGPFTYTFEFTPLEEGSRTRVVDFMKLTGGPEQEAMMAAGGGEEMTNAFVNGMKGLAAMLAEREEEPSASSG
ncbi:MAG: DUF2652 domain-containing protein [Actinomycetota bacterium]